MKRILLGLVLALGLIVLHPSSSIADGKSQKKEDSKDQQKSVRSNDDDEGKNKDGDKDKKIDEEKDKNKDKDKDKDRDKDRDDDEEKICHKEGEHNRHTLTIDHSAVFAHLRHGDSMGACPGSPFK
jgi:hypothetical protein